MRPRRLRGIMLDHGRLHRRGGLLALELVLDLRGPRRAGRRDSCGFGSRSSASMGTLTTAFLLLPAFSASSRCSAQSFLISAWAMSSASRISASGISLAQPRPSGWLLGARDDEVEVRATPPPRRACRLRTRSSGLPRRGSRRSCRRPSRSAPRRPAWERDVGQHQRRRSAVHREMS